MFVIHTILYKVYTMLALVFFLQGVTQRFHVLPMRLVPAFQTVTIVLKDMKRVSL